MKEDLNLENLETQYSSEKTTNWIISSIIFLFFTMIFLKATILSELNVWVYIISKIFEIIIVFIIVFFLIRYFSNILFTKK